MPSTALRRRPIGRAAALLATAALGVAAVAPAATAAPPDDDALVLASDVVDAVRTDDDLFLPGDGTGDDAGFVAQTDDDEAATVEEKLGDADQRLLGEAEAADEDTVTVLLAVEPGTAAAVERTVERHGGAVGRTEDDLGYVRATVPTDDVIEIAAADAVLAVDLDRQVDVPDPTPLDATADDAAAATGADLPEAPSASTGATNPYLPVAETGAVAFTDAHPTWDGRGTTIGVLDTGVDLDHPALRTTTDGKPKIVGSFTATDPVIDNDGTWIRLSTKRTGPTFTNGGTTYTIPAGSWYSVRFGENISTASEAAGDLDRDGQLNDTWMVIVDPQTGEVRVDGDQDGDLVEEEALFEYGVAGQVGHLGVDDPDTDLVESQPFTVEYRPGVDLSPLGGVWVGRTADYLNMGLVTGAHGTHVAGIAAGNGLLGGEVRGAAPGAQIVSARACIYQGGCTAVALTEGMIDLVVEHDVDVVNVSIGGLDPLNDGSDAIARLYDQLVRQYDVDIVAAAGNDGPGVNTVSAPSTGDAVISVAASVSDDTWFANYGARVGAALDLFPFSSRGPSEDGSLKPTVSAPGAAVSAIPTWLAGEPVAETGYDLPAGYGMFNGTSMASPQVAGAVALLRSAAGATGTAVTTAGVRSAVVDTADLIDGVQVAAQGGGVVDVQAAWKQLAKPGAGRPGTAGYTVTAPVCTSLSSVLTTPGSGPGVHDRCLPSQGGATPGERKTYDLQVTRTSGDERTVSHRLELVGDDGTFSVASTVKLPLGAPVTVPVTATPRTAGLHSALLRVDDPRTPGVDHVVPLTVVATQVAPVPSRTVELTGTVGRGGATSVFVAVPDGVQNLQMALTDDAGEPTSGAVRVRAFDPAGMPVDSGAACYEAAPGCDPAGRSYVLPRAGVWEFVVEGSRRASTMTSGFGVTVALQGVDMDPAAVTLSSADVHEPQPASVTATNTWGALTATPTEGALGRTVDLWSTVPAGGYTQRNLLAPRDATLVDFTVTPHEGSDVDVLLGHVGTGRVVARGQAVGDTAEHVVVHDPMPGSYAVIVSGMAGPGGVATFDYTEKVYSPSLGTVEVTSGTATALQPGDTLDVDVDVTALAHPFGSLPLVGTVPLTNAQGTQVGAAEVVVETVSSPTAEILATDRPFVGAAMNSSGVVAGDKQVDSRTQPVLWTAEGGATVLDMGADGFLGSAVDVNEAGTAVGQVLTRQGEIGSSLWEPDGTRVALGAPDWRPYESTYVYGVNDATDEHPEQVVGLSYLRERVDGVWHTYSDPWVWTREAGFRALPHLSADPGGTRVTAVNDAGWAVGTSALDGVLHAVRWSPAGEVEDLGLLPGMLDAVATSINAGGDVVGTSGDDAFLWTADDGMRRLPDLGYNGTATAITDEGLVIGAAESEPDYETPVVWDATGRLFDLQAMAGSHTILALQAFAAHGDRVLVYGYTVQSSGVAVLRLPAEVTAAS
ncbi:subtilase family protein [Isoptericola jiangsuensis]|uniref:Subtilase family protein n=1 Tax=Isoptericola jiangsuensis TaxID=548579 RepID=A0A2A9ESR8_9MICO|nr:S8 family serine peptidase [Isoptericola jiangsuensis]PFG41571.1 subtilase family protein [Isoptericola jiangsuensis]